MIDSGMIAALVLVWFQKEWNEIKTEWKMKFGLNEIKKAEWMMAVGANELIQWAGFSSLKKERNEWMNANSWMNYGIKLIN